jgi:hypothetical protein
LIGGAAVPGTPEEDQDADGAGIEQLVKLKKWTLATADNIPVKRRPS